MAGWQEVYGGRKLQCGATNEFYFKTRTGSPSLSQRSLYARTSMYTKLCTQLFTRLSGASCVNVNIGSDQGQWCYVDSSCAATIGGTLVPGRSDLSWKRCVQGADSMLRDSAPEQLASMSKSLDIDLGLLHKLAYPVLEHVQWADVAEAFLPDPLLNGNSVVKFVAQQVVERVRGGETMSIDTQSSLEPPHKIMHGDRVYTVERSPYLAFGHPGTYCQLKVGEDIEQLFNLGAAAAPGAAAGAERGEAPA